MTDIEIGDIVRKHLQNASIEIMTGRSGDIDPITTQEFEEAVEAISRTMATVYRQNELATA